jgi:hypothetical protein
MLSDFQKGLLIQQVRDESWRGGALLFAVIAFFALGWVLDFGDLRREGTVGACWQLALIGVASERFAALGVEAPIEH